MEKSIMMESIVARGSDSRPKKFENEPPTTIIFIFLATAEVEMFSHVLNSCLPFI
jgi:hypothetical protein